MADVARYLDPAATGTGAGTSWADAYTSYKAAVDDIKADYPDFTAAAVAVTLFVRGSNAWANADDVLLDFVGTTATNYFKLKGEEAASTGATFSTTAPEITSDDWDGVIRVATNHCTVEDLQIRSTRASGGSGQGVRWESGTYLKVNRCKMKTDSPEVNSGRQGVNINGNTATNKTLIVANCICIDYYFGMEVAPASGDHIMVYSCMMIGTGTTASNIGVKVDAGGNGTLRLKDTLATGFSKYAIGVLSSPATVDFLNNATDDGTGDDFGTGGRVNQTFTFVDPALGNYHLAGTDTGAKGYGADLSGDANYAFTDDIDIQNRAEPWDIGADATTTSSSSLSGAAAEGNLTIHKKYGGFALDPGGFMEANTDPNGNPVSYSVETGVTNGDLHPHPGGGFHYTPNTDFVGTDQFTYYVYADNVQSSLGTITLLVEDAYIRQAIQGGLDVFGYKPGFQLRTRVDEPAKQGVIRLHGQTGELSASVLGDPNLLVYGEPGGKAVLGFAGTAQEGRLRFYTEDDILVQAQQGQLSVQGQAGVLDLGHGGILTGDGPSDDGDQLDNAPMTVHLWATRPTTVKLRR